MKHLQHILADWFTLQYILVLDVLMAAIIKAYALMENAGLHEYIVVRLVYTCDVYLQKGSCV